HYTADYPLSLHDALPIWAARELRDDAGHLHGAEVGVADGNDVLPGPVLSVGEDLVDAVDRACDDVVALEHLHDLVAAALGHPAGDRKSTRLNSSHLGISY